MATVRHHGANATVFLTNGLGSAYTVTDGHSGHAAGRAQWTAKGLNNTALLQVLEVLVAFMVVAHA
jgi:hypothetical protein